MKTLFSVLFSVLLSSSILSQNYLHIGLSIEPALSLQKVRNLEDYSILPNINISYGNKIFNSYLSIGVVSKLGFLSIHKWTYAGASYTVNSMSKDFTEHGPEITTGFNYFFGKDEQFRFFAGSAIGMSFVTADKIKVVLRPFVVGLSFNLLN